MNWQFLWVYAIFGHPHVSITKGKCTFYDPAIEGFDGGNARFMCPRLGSSSSKRYTGYGWHLDHGENM